MKKKKDNNKKEESKKKLWNFHWRGLFSGDKEEKKSQTKKETISQKKYTKTIFKKI
jgi:hypothetical protein